MNVIPYRFLFRVMYACPYVAHMPADGDDRFLDLPESARSIRLRRSMESPRFADVRLAWNEAGLGLQVEVRGKENPPWAIPNACGSRTASLSGSTRVAIDRAIARPAPATSFICFPRGGGKDRGEPFFAQTRIHRALQDAPLAPSSAVPFRMERIRKGYRVEAFLGGQVLYGWDPEENPRLGVYYCVRDFELGDQTPGVGNEFPFGEDPSLWAVLELVKESS